MCMLTVIPAGVNPDMDGIRNGTHTNDDGHGWAIVTPRRVIIYHDMNAERAIERFVKCRGKNYDGPALFHSRWATHGTINESNCHPFRVGGDRRTVLAHNGVMYGECTPGKGDPRSDTKKFAQDIFPRFAPKIDSSEGFEAVKRFIGSSNKVAVVTANPRYAKSLYIFNESAGHWRESDGLWYSNRDYLPYSPAYDRHRWSGGTGKGTGVVSGKGEGSGGSTGWAWSGGNAYRQLPTGAWVPVWDPEDYDYGWEYPTVIGGKSAKDSAAVFSSGEASTNVGDILADADDLLAEYPSLAERRAGRYPSECPWCYSSTGIDPVAGVCEECNTCLDCVEPLGQCMCFMPGGAHHPSGHGQETG